MQTSAKASKYVKKYKYKNIKSYIKRKNKKTYKNSNRNSEEESERHIILHTETFSHSAGIHCTMHSPKKCTGSSSL